MAHLFLSMPPSHFSEDTNVIQDRTSLLRSLGSVIWSVITSGGRLEPRLWLCSTISAIRSIDPYEQRRLFTKLLETTSSKRDVAAQVLRMIFDKSPQKAGAVLASKCNILEKFFEGHPQRILQWFDHFAATGDFSHKKGARAISHFAFVNRNICWEELEWKGRHGQSPAVVATKPHYFHDLDVLRTVENFLEYVPDFWSSNELAESVKDGDILHIDTQFFVEQFADLMYEDKFKEIWEMIDEFLIQEHFSSLCQHLLILLNEHELRAFLDSICNSQCVRYHFEGFGCPSSWLEVLLSSNIDHITMDDFILVNAVVNYARKIVRLLSDDEHEMAKRKIEELLESNTHYSNEDHWSFMAGCRKLNLFVATKWISLQSWTLHYTLSRECKTKDYCELLFNKNGINFKKSGDYVLIPSIELCEESRSDNDDIDDLGNRKRKRKRSRKKKKGKKYGHYEADMDELIDFNRLDGLQDPSLSGGSWLLSTDGFSCPWNMADLPWHLSGHCFSSWMEWILADRHKL